MKTRGTANTASALFRHLTVSMVAMTEQKAKPIVFRCPATGIDVISPVRVNVELLNRTEDQPLMLPCFCGASHAVHLKRYVSKTSPIRRAADVPA